MKVLIETRGSFMLVDPYTGDQVRPHRPHVVTHTPFIETRIANKQLRLVNAEITDEATDEEFATFWAEAEGDRELAVESFVAKFTEGAEPEKPAPKKRRDKSAEE